MIWIEETDMKFGDSYGEPTSTEVSCDLRGLTAEESAQLRDQVHAVAQAAIARANERARKARGE